MNEKFRIKNFKNIIKIENNINEKLIITFDNKKEKKIEYISSEKVIFRILKYISKLIGTKIIGDGAIIFQIYLKNLCKKCPKTKIKIRKINQNLKIVKVRKDIFDIEIVCGKIKPFKPKYNKFVLNKSIIRKIRKKKFLFIGSSSDVAKILINSIKQYSTISTFSFRLKNKTTSIQNNFEKLRKVLKKNYNYIFYMSSVQILHGDKNNKDLLKIYKNVYYDFFKLIPDFILKKEINSKIFYPSTFALNKKSKFKGIRAYMHAKEMGEKICKTKDFKKVTYCPRLPQMKSRSNYNILGFYEGLELYNIKKYLINFLNY